MLLDDSISHVHPIKGNWTKATAHQTSLLVSSNGFRIPAFLFFSKENLSIILFVAITLTKKINEAVIEKMMPAKIRRHLKLYSWEV